MSEPNASAAAVKLQLDEYVRLRNLAGRQDSRTKGGREARANSDAALQVVEASLATLTASHAQLVETVERLTRERDELQTAGRQWREGCAMHGSCRTAQIMHEMETGK